MFSGLTYDAANMTLERFGFVGTDKKCYWGLIGVQWIKPLPIWQILPNSTEGVEQPEVKNDEKAEEEKPQEEETKKPEWKPP